MCSRCGNMIQHFLRRVLRLTGPGPAHRAGSERIPPYGRALPRAEPTSPLFLAQILKAALAQNREASVVHPSGKEPPPKPVPEDADLPDGNVIRPFPRRRPAPERAGEPPRSDDDDPGPGAA